MSENIQTSQEDQFSLDRRELDIQWKTEISGTLKHISEKLEENIVACKSCRKAVFLTIKENKKEADSELDIIKTNVVNLEKDMIEQKSSNKYVAALIAIAGSVVGAVSGIFVALYLKLKI